MPVLRNCLILFLAASPLGAAESFESAPAGPLKEFKSALGTFTADGVHARIEDGHAKSGKQSLRLAGEGECAVSLELASPVEAGALLSFHAERWTKRDPFELHIDARGKNGWKEIKDASGDVQVGGFLTEVRVELPAGTRELRFRSSAPTDAGVMLDDLSVLKPGPAKALVVETAQPVCPAFIRAKFNPVLGFKITVEGSEGSVDLNAIELSLEGTTVMDEIAKLEVWSGSANPAEAPKELVATKAKAGKRVSMVAKQRLAPGEHWFWVSAPLKETASLDGQIDVGLVYVNFKESVTLAPAVESPPGGQRIGYAVRLPGDDRSKSYRIPGLVRSKAGTLVAAYDIRYDHSGDLPANIDVGVSRSTDGGQSWEPMRVAIDMGDDPKHGHDGVGDPAILVDPKTGRLWIAALWSHGNRGWNGSGPGMKPEETGQLVLAYSDDDGKGWSKPVNLTEQMKKPEWKLFFNGPGAGIVLRDGTLAFAAQYRAADGKPWSTMIASKDGGKSWQVGSGVKSDTTEAQIAELEDGSVMINCRDNRGGFRTVATTKDLGANWELHATDRKALREPVCMGSLLAWKGALWFSNPDSAKGRKAMTLKRSPDQGVTWPDKSQWLYDSRDCFGYSCLAPVDEKHMGVIYEGSGELYFLRLPVGD